MILWLEIECMSDVTEKLMLYDKRHYKMEVANGSALLQRYPENIEKILKKLIS